MNELNQGSIVLVDFSYSNQHQSKLRPALVISNSANNLISRDVVVMKITKNKPKSWGISISHEDLVGGSLAYPSFVQIDAIYSLEKTIVLEVIGTVTPEKMCEIKIQISDLFGMT
jgi:mRNA-degrading endonuclease toxin of MazEF toxin-antitoxin module